MKTDNESILNVLLPLIGLLILSALIFSVVQSCYWSCPEESCKHCGYDFAECRGYC